MHILRRLEVLTDTVARLEAGVARREDDKGSPTPGVGHATPGTAGRLTAFVVAPVLTLMAAHYLAVFALNLRPAWLLSATIVVPMIFGASAFGKVQLRFGSWLILFFLSAVAAVIGMNLVTAAVVPESGSILPVGPSAWRETIQFTASIFLGFLSGYFLAYLLQCVRDPHHDRIRTANAEFRAVSAHLFTAASAASVERAGKYLASLMSLISATGAIYLGIQRL